MRTASEILEKYWNKKNYQQAYFVDQQSAILTAINEARKEAIEECAKHASVMYVTSKVNGRDYPQVNEQSVLSLINELK